MNLKPSLQALWLADDVAEDAETGKVNITGAFDQITVDAAAGHYTNPASLFFAITNVHSQADLTLAYVDLSDGSILVEQPVPVRTSGPLESKWVLIYLARIPTPHPGVFAWELHWNNEMIGTTRVVVETTPGDGNGEGGDNG